MYKAKYLTFHEVTEPITEPVTKFGGNPVWLTEPQWPVDAVTGEPMLFVGQVEVDPSLFGEPTGRLAYLFVPSSDPVTASVGELDENVMIIQPGGVCDQATLPLVEGPSVCRVETVKRSWLRSQRVAIPSEYAVETTLREEPPIDWEKKKPLWGLDFDWPQSKIGGQPTWIQGEQWPYEDPTPLLLQLVSGTYPFQLEIGDDGHLYACLSPDGREVLIAVDCY